MSEENIYTVRCKDKKQLEEIRKNAKIIAAYSDEKIPDMLQRILKKIKERKEG